MGVCHSAGHGRLRYASLMKCRAGSLETLRNLIVPEIVMYFCSVYIYIYIYIQGAYKLSEDFAKPYFHKY